MTSTRPPVAELVVLGSGSKGNAFALVHEGAVLLLEAGYSLREIDRRLAEAGLDAGALVGIAITHEHGDHAASATKLARRHDVPLLASFGTFHALARGGDPCHYLPIGSRGVATVGTLRGGGLPHLARRGRADRAGRDAAGWHLARDGDGPRPPDPGGAALPA